MSVEQMRTFLKDRYPSPDWEAKVDKMTDAQVVAIYNRTINSPRKPWFGRDGRLR